MKSSVTADDSVASPVTERETEIGEVAASRAVTATCRCRKLQGNFACTGTLKAVAATTTTLTLSCSLLSLERCLVFADVLAAKKQERQKRYLFESTRLCVIRHLNVARGLCPNLAHRQRSRSLSLRIGRELN